MYFNNLNIIYYVIIGIIGFIIGKFCAWADYCLQNKNKIFSKEFFKVNKEGIKWNYVYMILLAIVYVFILYKCGINYDEIYKNLDLIKYLILTPCLLLIINIDIHKRIIPNRLTLTMFEIGLIVAFIYSIFNLNMAKDYILGMIVGAAIFLIITLLGGLIAGKEAMGFGDVKLMGTLGLYFGVNSIIEITIFSFLIAAVYSIIVLIIRNLILKNHDEYIPFGPAISIASLFCIYLPTGYILDIFLEFCRNISMFIS